MRYFNQQKVVGKSSFSNWKQEIPRMIPLPLQIYWIQTIKTSVLNKNIII